MSDTPSDPSPRPPSDDIDVVVVTMQFTAADQDLLSAILSKYVVLTRNASGCRNIDLCRSAVTPERYVVIQKWESSDAQRAHFDSDLMVEMAQACVEVLREPPVIDLLDGISAHDLA